MAFAFSLADISRKWQVVRGDINQCLYYATYKIMKCGQRAQTHYMDERRTKNRINRDVSNAPWPPPRTTHTTEMYLFRVLLRPKRNSDGYQTVLFVILFVLWLRHILFTNCIVSNARSLKMYASQTAENLQWCYPCIAIHDIYIAISKLSEWRLEQNANICNVHTVQTSGHEGSLWSLNR